MSPKNNMCKGHFNDFNIIINSAKGLKNTSLKKLAMFIDS